MYVTNKTNAAKKYEEQALVNKTDIEQITNNMQELMKSKLIAVEEQLDETIDHQNINDDATILGVIVLYKERGSLPPLVE
ncbi:MULTISPECIES: hypothetical protein [unclassified Rickettsia]|uniref:hypothetical protein n=2 Tax=Rickettsia TaxID=780 RepID=UPI0031331145